MKTDEEKLAKLEELMVAIAWQIVSASKGEVKGHDVALEDRRKFRKQFLDMIKEE